MRATGAIRTAPEDIILTARNPERLEHAARELGALSTAAFDATDTDRLEQFFQELPGRSTTSSSPPAAPTTSRWPRWTSRERGVPSTST